MNPATIQKLCDLSGMELFPEGVERGLHRWRDETYDVWIDGCLDRQAQVLMRGAKAEHAVLSPRLRQVLLIDLERGVVNAAPREGFVLAPDRETALSEPTLSPQRVGSCSRFRGHGFLLSMEGGPHLVIVPPTGLIGELTPDRLWEDVPVWRAIFDSYEPEPGIVAELAAAGPYELTIVMAAWCHLSKELVPRLLRALERAANPGVRVRLIGVDSAFEEPPVIQTLGVTNVPSIIVERNGEEQGRIIETPVSETLESDVAAILRRAPLPHPGRWLRRGLVARGEIAHRSLQGLVGLEAWELFEVEDGGALVHSRIERDGSSTEVWHRLDIRLRAEMIEVTERAGKEASRLRALVTGDRLTVVVRGVRCGKLEQSLRVPEAFAFASPAAAGAGGWLRLREPGAAYVLSDNRAWGAGTLHPGECRASSVETIEVGAGTVQALPVSCRLSSNSRDWWVLPDLPIPVRGFLPGGLECTLETLEILSPRRSRERSWQGPSER